MENKQNDYALFLAMLTSPAFIVQNGKVTQVNNQAKQMVIYPGDDIAPMLKDNPTLLETMDESTVSFTLTIEIFRCNAIITKLSDGFLFTIDDQVSSEVKALFLMVKQLRPSFARLQSLGLKHKELVPPDIRREMFRINRIFVNATNARRYSFKDAQFMQERDLCSVVDCTLEECAALLKEGGIELKYTIPKEAIHTLCDNLMIEQAVYNLICNAAQYADEGEAIEVELSRNDNIAQLTVTNRGKDFSSAVRANMFSCFAHELNMMDGVAGMGLGMVVVHKVALAHGGTVLVRHDDKCTQVSMTVQIKPNTSNRLCSPFVTVISPQDDGMVMLSEVLPKKLYDADCENR